MSGGTRMWTVILTVGFFSLTALAKDVHFEAYDCEDPGNPSKAYSALEAGSCVEPITDFDLAPKQIYGQILQTYTEGMATVHSCYVQQSIAIVYCGMSSWTAAGDYVANNELVALHPLECQKVLETKKFLYFSRFYSIKDNEVIKEVFYPYGGEGKDNTKHDGSCTAAAFSYKGKSYDQHFMRVTVTMNFHQTFQPYDMASQTIVIEPFQIRGQIETGGFYDARYGTFAWTVENDDDCDNGISGLYAGPINLYLHKNGYSQSYIQMYNETAGIGLATKLKQSKVACGRLCYATVTPNLLVCDIYDGELTGWRYDKVAFDRNAPQTNLALQTSMGLTSFLKSMKNMKNFLELKSEMCNLEQAMIRSTLNDIAGGNKYGLLGNAQIGKGKLVRKLGATLYVIECKEVTVKFHKYDNCTQEIPVIFHDKLQFVDPLDMIIHRKPTVVDCLREMPPMWYFNGEWICGDALGYRNCDPPATLNPRIVSRVNGTGSQDIMDGAGKGVDAFGEERRKARKEAIARQLSGPASLNHITRNVTNVNGYAEQGGISVPFFGDIIDKVGLGYNLFGWLSYVYDWIFYYLAFKVLCEVIGWSFGAFTRLRIMHAAYGCTPFIVFGLCETVFSCLSLPATLMAASIEESKMHEKEKAEHELPPGLV